MPEKKQILIVDDDADIRRLLLDFLEGEGFRVLVAEDGSQAISLAKEHIPDLVITDMLLQKEHGLEVLEFVKERFFIPVIAISGVYDPKQILAQVEEHNIDGFFAKPLDLQALLEKVKSILHA
jgi:CheY-like chemotaxis protein